MTKDAILKAVRSLVRETNSDRGGVLDDEANLYEYICDAQEQVVLDLMPYMPEQFLDTEDTSLVANQQSYNLTKEWWMIFKVEKNVSSDSPKELDIIDPLQKQDYMTVGETEAEPTAVYFMGTTIYFVKIPSENKTNYAKFYIVRPEVMEMGVDGPTYIPRMAHRLIIYRAAALVAASLEADAAKNRFDALYGQRFSSVIRLWSQRYISQPRYVQSSMAHRRSVSVRDRVLYDEDWP